MSNFADYAWIIDKDYTVDFGDIEPDPNGHHRVPPRFSVVDVAGPYNVDPTLVEQLTKGGGEAFQLWDDDGILYYTGRWIEGEEEDNPLFDYGTPNAGATEMTVGNRQPYI